MKTQARVCPGLLCRGCETPPTAGWLLGNITLPFSAGNPELHEDCPDRPTL